MHVVMILATVAFDCFATPSDLEEPIEIPHEQPSQVVIDQETLSMNDGLDTAPTVSIPSDSKWGVPTPSSDSLILGTVHEARSYFKDALPLASIHLNSDHYRFQTRIGRMF